MTLLQIILRNFNKISNIMLSTWRCCIKKLFIEILQNAQENTCVGFSFLMKLQASCLQRAIPGKITGRGRGV